MVKLAVLGSTGPVGTLFCTKALDRGHSVTALARTPSKMTLTHKNLKIVQGDATSKDDVAKLCAGADVVVSCVGQPPRAATHIMEKTAANILAGKPKKIIVVSSLGLCGSSPLIRYALLPIAGSLNLRDAERADALVRDANCPWVCVRPAALGDGAGKGKYLATEATGASFAMLPRDDVALFLADAAESDHWDRKAVQLYAA